MKKFILICLVAIQGLCAQTGFAESTEGAKMNTREIIGVAKLVAKSDQVEKLQAALTALLEPTRQEPGCLSYELYRDLDNPNLFIMLEKFISKDAFTQHMNQPYIKNFSSNVGELTESVSVNLLAKFTTKMLDSRMEKILE